MKRRHFLKGIAAVSLASAAIGQSGLAMADLDRLERQVRQEGREEIRERDRREDAVEREVRQEGREEIRERDRREDAVEREIRQEGRQKGNKLDRRI